MNKAVREYLKLSDAEIEFLNTIQTQISIVADLSRADILFYSRQADEEAVVLAHAQPHSLAHVYNKNRQGRVIGTVERVEVWRALISGKSQGEINSVISEGAPVVRQAFPVYYPPSFPVSPNSDKPRVIAAIIIVTNQIEFERLKLRSNIFRKALQRLQEMLLYGRVRNAESLTSFGERDGILVTDNQGIIQYASGVAANLYRRLGYKETLVGRHLSHLDTGDDELRLKALAQNCCLEEEAKEDNNRVWVRKVVPLFSYPSKLWSALLGLSNREIRDGMIITLHDATDIRRRNQELRIKNAMIQEVHHRVKNNLQTIAGLLRMQLRRVKTDEARLVLEETLHRILSIAVIHEFLSHEDSNIINIKEISHRIVSQMQQGILSPEKMIRFEVTGEAIYLPSRQATACSLIINELLQNAFEHGFENKKQGLIRIHLADGGDEVTIKVNDNGSGLPADFKIDQVEGSLGLHIVKILVEGDLRGQFHLENGTNNSDIGVSVIIKFPKTVFGGEQGWKEHVSS